MPRKHIATRHIPCSVDGCVKQHDAHGFCQMHRLRVQRNGTPELRPKPSLRDRIEAGYLEVSGCWIWIKAMSSTGYGSISVEGRPKNAHKASYEEFIGPVPEGKVLDHLCRNTACVNPAHLEPVTQSTNVRRGNRARGTSRL